MEPVSDDARDAARYRWLRDAHPATDPVIAVSSDNVTNGLRYKLLDEAIDAAIAEQSGWIKCSERMPPRDRQVLIWDGVQVWMDCWEGKREGMWDDELHPGDLVVTHWRPLPRGASDE